MANDDEREALLGPDDGFSSSRRSGATAAGGPRQKIKSLYESDQVLGRHSPYRAEDEAINICGGGASNSLQILSEADHIVAVFVVAFDTKAGRWISRSLPPTRPEISGQLMTPCGDMGTHFPGQLVEEKRSLGVFIM